MRWRRLEVEFGDRIEVLWKSFLLRPTPHPVVDPASALEKFRRYTESWMRVAAQPDAGEFRLWQSDEGPPSHSVPPHLVSKAAARLGKDAFERIHDRLMHAYFFENRDITSGEVLLELWLDVGLDGSSFPGRREPELLQAIIDDHNEAFAHGATGVPAARLEDDRAVIVGAQPIERYRSWIEAALARRGSDTHGGDHSPTP